MVTQIKEMPRENGGGMKLVCGQWKDGQLKKKFFVYKDGAVKKYSDAICIHDADKWEKEITEQGKELGL